MPKIEFYKLIVRMISPQEKAPLDFLKKKFPEQSLNQLIVAGILIFAVRQGYTGDEDAKKDDQPTNGEPNGDGAEGNQPPGSGLPPQQT